ncbi:MAG: geranylgeranylglyceryl/heptaprenylglyceryl phosphate synthase [Crenarchaeota archaeon]|nr:geranylgeranylglyceryl/heptaprenylglyceryl phosphate synthase [Thermoproteota archaeon]
MAGPIERYLLDKIRVDGTIHMTLIDPEKTFPYEAVKIAENANFSGTAAIMIGGSTVTSQKQLDEVVQAIKSAANLPLILFPGNVSGISSHADAIWFMSMLNSTDPYFLIGAQILGAPYIKKFQIEPLSMGYIIVGEGGTAGKVGKAIPVPYNNPELAAAHALAGQYLGMRFIYLEGGSGVKIPVPPEMIRAVKQAIDIPLIVGGGIRSTEAAIVASNAGADAIVTGNLIETSEGAQRVAQITKAIKRNLHR